MRCTKPRKIYKRKEWDFKPSKESQILGALKDLGKSVNTNHYGVARRITSLWGEEI